VTERTEVDHLRDLMDERDRRYEQRYEESQKAIAAALSAADRAVQAALQAAKEAVTKAELSADKRFELLNELRSGVATTEQIDALDKVVNSLKEQLDKTSGRGAGVSAVYGWIIGAVGLIVSIVVMANVLTH
jgi:multidrug resistance efflux pump